MVFVKFVNAQQAKQSYQYKNNKEKLYKTNVAIWYKKYATKTDTNMKNASCCEYSVKTPEDGQEVCPKNVECFTKIMLRNSASFWILL